MNYTAIKTHKIITKSNICLLAALFLAACGSQARFAFVDVQRALNETKAGKAAKSQLAKIHLDRQKQLDDRQRMLKNLELRIQLDGPDSNEATRAHQADLYRKAIADLQTTYTEFQRDLQAREREETGRIVEKMRDILEEIGEREGYTAILEVNEGGVFFRDKALDLTGELIEAYDQRYPPGEGTAYVPPRPGRARAISATRGWGDAGRELHACPH